MASTYWIVPASQKVMWFFIPTFLILVAVIARRAGA